MLARWPLALPRRWPHLLLGLVLSLLWSLAAQAQDVQPVPPLTARVIDTSGTLAAERIARLEAKLAALEQDKGAQVVVLMVPTTAPEDIAAYANRVGNAWKIGRRDVGDGLIVLVAVQDRRMRIEVAKTLEGAVPDIAAKRIIDQAMAPRFRQGDYAGGLDAAVDQLAARIRGEALPPVDEQARATALGESVLEVAVLLFVALPFINAAARGMLGRKLGALATSAGAGALAYVFTTSVALAVLAGLIALMYALFASVAAALSTASGGARRPRSRDHWGGGLGGGGFGGGGWGGSGGFGGGFGSGGGGNFGGGGASGSW